MTEIRQAEPLSVPQSDALRFLPEGPYPVGESLFSWVGIQHGADAIHGSLNLYDLRSGVNESFDVPGRPGFAFPCHSSDTFVIGADRSLGFFRLAGRKWDVFCDRIDQDVEGTLINDGVIYEDNLIFGTKDPQAAEAKAGLYLWRGRDQKLIRMRDDQTISNGKAIFQARDGGPRLIDIDSPTRQVVSYRLDVDSATVTDREVVLDLTDDPAVPDGAILTPDASGLIVSMFLPQQAAEYGQTRLYHLDSGRLECTWQTPGSPQNTCPALVRHQGKLMLIITTAVEHLSEADQEACPNAGKLFIGETDLADSGEPLAPVFPK